MKCDRSLVCTHVYIGSPWFPLYQRTVASLSSGSSVAVSQGRTARPPRTTHTVMEAEFTAGIEAEKKNK